MILSSQSIRKLCLQGKLVRPFSERTKFGGASYGLSAAGYDVRLAEPLQISPGEFKLSHTLESFDLPNNVMGWPFNKSTWARMGLNVFRTVIEPGWYGETLTLEISNKGNQFIVLPAGVGIAQIVFVWLDKETAEPYEGKYQNAPAGAQAAILE